MRDGSAATSSTSLIKTLHPSAKAEVGTEATEWWERVKDPSPLRPDWEPLFSLRGCPKYFGEP